MGFKELWPRHLDPRLFLLTKFAQRIGLTRLGNTRVGPARFWCLRVEPGPYGFRQLPGGSQMLRMLR